MKKHTQKRNPKQSNAVQYKHDLGQHFLYDMDLLRSLVAKIGLSTDDVVLEIGPGAGTLTRVLCETAKRVTAVEVDEALIPHLLELTAEYDNFELIHHDIRRLNLADLALGEGYWVVANIPYSITTQIFDLFWGKDLPVKRMAVMVQKEVADKLTATPGNKAYGLMSVRCRYYCEAEIIAHVPALAFTPPPKVDSAFVSLTFRETPPAVVADENLLWRMIRAGYNARRKTLLNALKSSISISTETMKEALERMDLLPTVRGEELDILQWISLSNALEPLLRTSRSSSTPSKPR